MRLHKEANRSEGENFAINLNTCVRIRSKKEDGEDRHLYAPVLDRSLDKRS